MNHVDHLIKLAQTNPLETCLAILGFVTIIFIIRIALINHEEPTDYSHIRHHG